MKPLIAQTVRAMKAGRNILMAFLLACGLHAQSHSVDPGLTAHEWGTFTSVAGNHGQAVIWRPLSLNDLSFDKDAGPSDNHYHSKELPSFVETLHWGAFKQGLSATIRMETPVLYFYSSHPVILSVQVKFTKGLITEWYPHAVAPVVRGGLDDAGLYSKGVADGAIFWNAVALEPGLSPDLPRDSDDNGNRYYAARETLATPLRVNTPNGARHEKFLFYRGVSLFPLPVSAIFTSEGKLRVRNLLKQEIPEVILFERRGERVGYRMGGTLQDDVDLDPPQLTSTVERLYGDLEEMLVARGLYGEEAHAMLETWRNTWFEEGSRLFYIVPSSFVESILPLSITPAPAQIVRVFVGRLELVSPTTQKAVTAALAANDKVTLAQYGRFLEPILSVIRGKNVAAVRPVPESLAKPCPAEAARSVDLDKHASRKLAGEP
jgi:hypothetical protein